MPFQDIFGQFGTGGGAVAMPLAEYPIDREFIEMALELIDDFVPTENATWNAISNPEVADPDEPWVVTPGDVTTYPVRIVFDRTTLSNLFLRYRPNTTLGEGDTYGIMYKTYFTPKQKDTVTWNGRTLVVEEIADNVSPIKDTIIYIIRFCL